MQRFLSTLLYGWAERRFLFAGLITFSMPQLKENVSLAHYSHYKIGGPARFFFNAKSEKEVVWAVREAKKRKLKVFVLAGGTNLLIGDNGFPGLVVRPDLTTLNVKGSAVRVGAGVLVADLLSFVARRSLAGLEWAGGLPGTLGGAVRGNAGCFGGEIKDVIASVRSLDTRRMAIVERSAAQCRFSYRDSIFKKKRGTEIVLGATLRLAKGDMATILAAAKEKIAYREKHHPLEYPNIGSTFKNVPLERFHKSGSKPYRTAIAAGAIRFRDSQFSVKTDPLPVISAAKLIGESGLCGVTFGGAMISPKHPNFIVNVLSANAHDVNVLIGLAKAEVLRKFGVQLEEEVQII
jgi:UDP-N-acetylmuramate dehydrogenase